MDNLQVVRELDNLPKAQIAIPSHGPTYCTYFLADQKI